MSFTNWAEQKILHHIFRSETWTPPAQVYLGLFTAAPGEESGGTEVTGGSYARQPVVFGPYDAGYVYSTSNVIFTNMPGVDIVGGAFFDSVVGGNMIMYKTISARSIPAGLDLLIAVAELRAGMD